MDRLWKVTAAGGTVGLAVGIAFQLALEVRHERAIQQVTQEFAPWSPPLMVSVLKPEVIPIGTCFLFAMLGAFVLIAWSFRKSSKFTHR